MHPPFPVLPAHAAGGGGAPTAPAPPQGRRRKLSLTEVKEPAVLTQLAHPWPRKPGSRVCAAWTCPGNPRWCSCREV